MANRVCLDCGWKDNNDKLNVEYVRGLRKAAEIATGRGNAAYRERQERFTSKSKQHLIIVQDVADDIADAILQEAAKEN